MSIPSNSRGPGSSGDPAALIVTELLVLSTTSNWSEKRVPSSYLDDANCCWSKSWSFVLGPFKESVVRMRCGMYAGSKATD